MKNHYSSCNPYKINIHNLLSVSFVLILPLGAFYALPSGLPQPGDIFLLLWSLLAIIFGVKNFSKLEVSIRHFLLYFLLLVFYIYLVNSYWSVVLYDFSMWINNAFYIYNFVVTLGVATLLSPNYDAGRACVIKAFIYSTFFCFFLLLLNFDISLGRQTGGFNNPNQLGYYALLLFCGLSIFAGSSSQLSIQHKVSLALSTLMVLFSFSLTATVALGIAWFGFSVRVKKAFRYIFFMALLTPFLYFLVSFATLYENVYLVKQWENRVSVIDTKTDNVFEKRGYMRILENPEYIVLGAGEGARWRFTENRETTVEIHSTVGTLLFSYGLPGLFLFVLLVLTALKGVDIGGVIIVLSPLLYSLTHQGLRTTTFWIFLLLVAFYAKGLTNTKSQVVMGSRRVGTLALN